MPKWTFETALAELTRLQSEIPALLEQTRNSPDHVRWGIQTLQLLEDVFGPNSRFYLTFANLKWYETGSFIVGGPSDALGAYNPKAAIHRQHQEAYKRSLGAAQGVLQAADAELRKSGLENVYEGKDSPVESSVILKVLNLAERQLRKTVRELPERERVIQDAFENLLIGASIDYTREAETFPYSSKTYIPDFCLARIDLVIEIKLSAREGREKELIAEINDDILAYSTRYGNQLYVIYDCGFIRDVDRFVSSFEQNDKVVVRVVKH